MLSSLKLHTGTGLEIVGGSEKAGFNAEDAQSGVPCPSHTLGVALATGQLRRRLMTS